LIARTQSLTDSATARAYIRSLAIRFEDPADLFAFLGLCDIAQAGFVHVVIEEVLNCRLKQDMQRGHRTYYHVGQRSEGSQCNEGWAELELAKEHLRILLS